MELCDVYRLSRKILVEARGISELPLWAITLAPILAASHAHDYLVNDGDPKCTKSIDQLIDSVCTDLSAVLFYGERNRPISISELSHKKIESVLIGTVCIYGHKKSFECFSESYRVKKEVLKATTEDKVLPEEIVGTLIAAIDRL